MSRELFVYLNILELARFADTCAVQFWDSKWDKRIESFEQLGQQLSFIYNIANEAPFFDYLESTGSYNRLGITWWDIFACSRPLLYLDLVHMDHNKG